MTFLRSAATLAFKCTLCCFLASVLNAGCTSPTVRQSEEEAQELVDTNASQTISLAGKLFSIPSPVLTAIQIKESGDPYRSYLLHHADMAANYSTKAGQALNIGIYGADMAYAALYDEGQQSLDSFRALELLADHLGVKGALEPGLINRLSANTGNVDSLLELSATFSRQADAYLKKNERYDVAAMILAGGWTEAAYLTAAAASEGSATATERLASQKRAIHTLVGALRASSSPDFTKSKAFLQLDSLNNIYARVKYTYTYAEPVTAPESKMTVLKGKGTYTMDAKTKAETIALLSRTRATMTAL